jgi:hypothetical protein
VTKEGLKMEAYFDKEKNRWVGLAASLACCPCCRLTLQPANLLPLRSLHSSPCNSRRSSRAKKMPRWKRHPPLRRFPWTRSRSPRRWTRTNVRASPRVAQLCGFDRCGCSRAR